MGQAEAESAHGKAARRGVELNVAQLDIHVRPGEELEAHDRVGVGGGPAHVHVQHGGVSGRSRGVAPGPDAAEGGRAPEAEVEELHGADADQLQPLRRPRARSLSTSSAVLAGTTKCEAKARLGVLRDLLGSLGEDESAHGVVDVRPDGSHEIV